MCTTLSLGVSGLGSEPCSGSSHSSVNPIYELHVRHTLTSYAFLGHLQCDSNLLIDSQHLVGYLHLVVHVRTNEHLLATSQLEDTMELASQDCCGMFKLRHHADDHILDGGRAIYVAESTHRHLQRSEQHVERTFHVRGQQSFLV
jgi:hypothetical protein